MRKIKVLQIGGNTQKNGINAHLLNLYRLLWEDFSFIFINTAFRESDSEVRKTIEEMGGSKLTSFYSYFSTDRKKNKPKDEIMKTLLGESTFSQDLLSNMLKVRKMEYIELEIKLEDAQNKIMQIDQEHLTQKAVCEEFDDWSTRFDNAPTADKKAMLLNIIDSIDIYPSNISIQFKLQLPPTQPSPD